MLKTDINDKTKYKILFDKSNFEDMTPDDENKFDNVSL